MTNDLLDRLEAGLRAEAATLDLPTADLAAVRARHKQRARRRTVAWASATTAAVVVAVVGLVGLRDGGSDAEMATIPPMVDVEVTSLADDTETGIYRLASAGDVLLGLEQYDGLRTSSDGRTWTAATPPGWTADGEIVVILSEPDAIIVPDHDVRDDGTYGIVHVSTDKGRTWTTEHLPDARDVALYAATLHDGTIRVVGNKLSGRYSATEAMAQIQAAIASLGVTHDDVSFNSGDAAATDDPGQPDATQVAYELLLDGDVVASGTLAEIGVPDEVSHRAFGGGGVALEDYGLVTYTRRLDGVAWAHGDDTEAHALGIWADSITGTPSRNLLVARGGMEPNAPVLVSQDAERWAEVRLPDDSIATQVFVGPHGVYAWARPPHDQRGSGWRLLRASDLGAVRDERAWTTVTGIPAGAVVGWIADTERGVVVSYVVGGEPRLAVSGDGRQFSLVEDAALDGLDPEWLPVVALDNGRIFGLAAVGDNRLSRVVRIDIVDR